MILLAGGIGSGKSVVARILRLKGYGVYDCDSRASWLMENDEPLRAELMSVAGKETYDASGRLDRKYLAGRLFAEAELRNEVNRTVHSAVRDDIRKWLDESDTNIFVESAIGAESGLLDDAEEVWLVVAREKDRFARVLFRDPHRSKEDILRIIKLQENEERRILASDIPVFRINNIEDDSLISQIDRVLRSIKN